MTKAITKESTYPINRSPFYKLRYKKKLCELLGLNINNINKLLNKPNNYYITTTKSGRKCTSPREKMKTVHKRISILLNRIEPPNYLHSRKKRSYITNAKQHFGNYATIKLDIRKFFPSTSQQHVYDFFLNVMKCSKGVSKLLAKICTTEGCIPTGSCLSQVLAFYTHIEMFDEISQYTNERGLIMTCYVDDITISGSDLTKKAINDIRIIIRKRGLNSHRGKERFYAKGAPKVITGVIVSKSKISLPNRRHKKIYDDIKSLNSLLDINEKNTTLNRLRGCLNEASQIDSSFKKKIKKLNESTAAGLIT